MKKLFFKFMLYIQQVSTKYIYNHTTPKDYDKEFWGDDEI